MIISVKIYRAIDGAEKSTEASAEVEEDIILHTKVSRMDYITKTVKSLVKGLENEITGSIEKT